MQDWIPDDSERFFSSAVPASFALEPEPLPREGGDYRLSLSPEDLDEAFAIARMGVWRWQVDSTEFIWSRELYRIAGRNPRTFLPTFDSTLDSIHPEDRERIRGHLHSAIEACDTNGCEFRVVRPDGRERHCWAKLSPITEAGRARAVRGVILDVTDRRLADIALQASEEHYRNTVELSPQMPWTADAAGNVLTISGRWSMITGLPEAAALGSGWLAKVYREDRSTVLAAAAQSLASAAPLDVKARLICADGSQRWFRSRANPKLDPSGRVLHWYGLSEDIHEQELTLARLRESEEHYRYTVELNPQIPWTADPEGNILDAGPRWTELIGTEPQRWVEALHPDDVAPTLDSWAHSLRTGERVDLRYRLKRLDGTYRWCRVRAGPRYSESGAILKWYGVVEDIDEQKTAQDRISWTATHDALTRLPNRGLFDTQLVEGLARAEAAGEGLALFVLDVDHFKQINDTLGHDAGDAVLRALGDRLRSTVRPMDTVARLGGDEFALILPGVGSEEEAAAISARILERLREPVSHAGGALDCRASIGASIYPAHGATAGELLKHADLALYSSKAGRRGGLLVYAPYMQAELQQRVTMTAVARAAVQEDRIRPWYQPKVDLRTRRIAGFEALARLVDADGGVQLPAAIAAAFDDPEVSTALTRKMLEHVVRQMRDWRGQGRDFGHVALNASTADLQRDDFAETILQCLHENTIPPQCLQLEVTETVFLARGADRVARSLRILSEAGVRIALDDFGTGYASLSHLKQFPVDIIKIDRSFVSDIRADAQHSVIAETVITLGKNLGIEVVAEGIETEAQADWLLRAGCHYGQGFLFSPAVPAGALEDFAGEFRLGN